MILSHAKPLSLIELYSYIPYIHWNNLHFLRNFTNYDDLQVKRANEQFFSESVLKPFGSDFLRWSCYWMVSTSWPILHRSLMKARQISFFEAFADRPEHNLLSFSTWTKNVLAGFMKMKIRGENGERRFADVKLWMIGWTAHTLQTNLFKWNKGIVGFNEPDII